MEKVFKDDTKAWSAWTRTIEARAGDPGSPYIVQAGTILRPLQLSASPHLNTFRKLRLADSLPSYTQANKNTYVSSGMTVADGYPDYLIALNQVLRRKYPDINGPEIEQRLKRFDRKANDYRDFLKDAREDWQRAKAKEPALPRPVWEEEYGYRDKRAVKEAARDEAYGEYLQAAAPYPELARVARALGLVRDPRQFVKLPMDDSEVGDDGLWNEFLKTYIDADFAAFLKTTTLDELSIDESSSSSSQFESRWSGSASLGFGFFSFGGGASGGTLDAHLREDAVKTTFKFKNLNRFPIVRGPWYQEMLVRLHCRDVPFDDYWGARGALNLIPAELVFGRGLTVEIDTAQRAYDEFRNWYAVHASAGFSIGPFRIGGSGGYSQSLVNIKNTSSGTTIRIEDQSEAIYLIGVISLKMSDLVQDDRAYFASLAQLARMDAALADDAWTQEFAPLGK